MVGDKISLKVSPLRGVKRFGLQGKLGSLYVEPYENLNRVGLVTYQLALPPRFAGVHNVYYVLTLREYISNSTCVLRCELHELREDMT